MLRHLVSTLASSAAALLASCTIGPLPSDAGASGDAGSQSVGDQCNAMALHLCTNAINNCVVLDTVSDCVANQVPLCCSGSQCNLTSLTSPSALAACTSALDTEDCFSTTTEPVSAVPACQGVPDIP